MGRFIPVFLILLVLVLFLHWFLAHSTVQFLRTVCPGIRPIFIYLLFGLLAAVMLLRFALRGDGIPGLAAVGDIWMGVFVLLLLWTLLGSLVILAGKLFHPTTDRLRRIVGILVAAVTVGTSAYALCHAGQVKLKTYEVTLKKPCACHVALVSDLHLGATFSERNLERTVAQLKALSPDVVCIAGDLFNDDFSSVEHPERVRELLQCIPSAYGVYACWGNHDSGDSRERSFVESCGIRLLQEEAVTVGDKLTLVGRSERAGRGDTAAFMASVSGDLPVIVLDHNPAHIGEYDSADLILCGHTHRGQIFPANLITNAIYQVDYGYYRQDDTQVIVTSGACYWGMPMRLGSDSEVVSILLD